MQGSGAAGARPGELQTQKLTDRNPGGQSDPVALGVRANQLLPHEEDRSDIQGICYKLVDDHEDDGHIPGCIYRHHTIHITCKSDGIKSASNNGPWSGCCTHLLHAGLRNNQFWSAAVSRNNKKIEKTESSQFTVLFASKSNTLYDHMHYSSECNESQPHGFGLTVCLVCRRRCQLDENRVGD